MPDGMGEAGAARPGAAGKRRAEVAKRLKEEGLKLLASRGIFYCKVEDITRASGVGKGTFFTHFPSKEAFVAGLVDQVLSDLARRVAPVGLSPTEAEALISGVAAVHLRYFQLRPEAASLLIQACALTGHETWGESIYRRLREHIGLMARMMAPAAESLGWPRERTPDLALMILANACGYFWFGGTLALGTDTPTGLLDRLARAVARGLKE